MPASFYTLGPADIFVDFRVSDNAGNVVSAECVYFGTSITSTEVQSKTYKLDVFNDLSGRQVPILRIDDGVEHDILLSLNRFDMDVWRRIQAGGSGPQNAGVEGRFTRGRIHTGVTDVGLRWLYSFPANGIAVPADSPIGRRYYSCTLRGGKESRVGSRVEELTLAFTATPLFNPNDRSFTLFSEISTFVTAGLPNIT